jgi:hypothetical protein
MEERRERGLDRTRRFRGIFDLELARFDANAYDLARLIHRNRRIERRM